MTNIPSRCCTHAHSRQQGLISRTMKSERGVHKKDCTLAGAAAAGADYMAFAGVLRRAQVLANQWSAVHGLSAAAGRFQYMADVARALQVGLGLHVMRAQPPTLRRLTLPVVILVSRPFCV